MELRSVRTDSEDGPAVMHQQSHLGTERPAKVVLDRDDIFDSLPTQAQGAQPEFDAARNEHIG